MDIATLSYNVDSSGLAAGERALDSQTKAAERAGAAADELGNRYQQIARRGMEYAERMRQGNVSERAQAEAAREAALGIDTKAQATATAAQQAERMAQRVEAMRKAEEREARMAAESARQKALQELNLRHLLGQIDPTIARLERLGELEGNLERALDVGAISPEVFDHYQGKLEATRAATLNLGKAQDIATASLGKLNLNTVEAQQSIASLARAMATGQWGMATSSITSLAARTGALGAAFSAAGLAVAGTGAAVIGAVALYEKGAREMREFERALILTGNSADTTAVALNNLADQMDKLEGVTARSAAHAITEIARTGEFTRGELEMVTEAALKWQRATGQSIETTIQHFRNLKRDPIRALEELDRQMNFVTPQLYEQARALDEAGNKSRAAALGMDLYADTIATRTPQMTQNLGLIESGWDRIKTAAGEAWDAILGWGRTPTTEALEQSIRVMESQLHSMPGDSSASAAQIATRRRLERALADARDQLREQQRQLVEGGVDAAIGFGRQRIADIADRKDAGNEVRELGDRLREPPNFTADARRELDALMEAEVRAREAFEARAATLAGPVAEAEYQHAVRLQQLRDLAEAGGVTAAERAEAEANLVRQHEANKAAIEARLNPAARMIEQLEFENRLMAMSNAERELVIQLRALDVEATDEQIDALRRLNEEREANMQLIDMMDSIRHAGSDLMTDWATGAKSFGDALEGSLQRLKRQLVQMAMDQMIQQLLGGFGTTGGGGGGGGLLGVLLGALFGGGREHGGPVHGGRMYQVGERNKPELLSTASGQYLIPGDRGKVTPMGHAAPRTSNAPMQVIINNNAPGVRAEPREERIPTGDGYELRRLVVDVIAGDFAEGGKSLAALKARTGIRDQV